jgi:glycosyltransferase involved in cell wall biosynthesis
MADVSVTLCTHNPRRDYLTRVLDALNRQTLSKDQWELIVVDNASRERLSDTYDLSWHPRARHVREDTLGLVSARLRGIAETQGDLLVFVDDDNVLATDFLEEACAIHERYPCLGAFGAGNLEPEFEIEPPPELRSRLSMLALRTVRSARWSNNPRDSDTTPWGAGLCVSRAVAMAYCQLLERLDLAPVLGRTGSQLFAGDDDLVSWAAVAAGADFGVFPQLRVTHLILASRLSRSYFVRLIRDHAFSHGILQYRLRGVRPRRIDRFRLAHLFLHGLRNGRFSLQCQWAEAYGEDRAARLVAAERLPSLEAARERSGPS